MPLEARDEWRGPLLITHLKARLRQFMYHDIPDCTEPDQVYALVVAYKAEMDQARHDMPDWFDSAKDFVNTRLQELNQGDDYGIDGERR